MTKLDDELKFLRAFKVRFSNSVAYRGAIEDMWREGLITPKAYKEIVSDEAVQKTTSKVISVNRVAKKIKNPLEKETKVVDPCSHGGGYRSSC